MEKNESSSHADSSNDSVVPTVHKEVHSVMQTLIDRVVKENPEEHDSKSAPVHDEETNNKKSTATPSPQTKSNAAPKQCWVCYEAETPDTPLIAPCNCKGSMQYVHMNCLLQWLEQSHTTTCPHCHHTYETKTTRK